MITQLGAFGHLGLKNYQRHDYQNLRGGKQ
jgi:hypothetical protein